MIELVTDLQGRLAARADARTRRWWTRYLRGAATFRGVPMAGVREEMHRWYDHYGLGELLTPVDRLRLAVSLLQAPFTEDKLSGILLLQERLLPAGEAPAADLLPVLADVFDEGFLADWNVVDWCCVKVLAPLITRDGRPCEQAILAWANADVLWRARASVVAFAPLAGRLSDESVEGVLRAASVVLAREERFAKTGVGWVLRELSERWPDRTAGFISSHLADFDMEALRNATKRLPPATGRALVSAFRSI